MKRLGLSLIFGILMAFFSSATTHAISQGVIINAIQLASSSDSSHEIVELYNGSVSAVNLTGWSIEYINSTGSAKLLTPENIEVDFLLKPSEKAVFYSKSLCQESVFWQKSVELSNLAGTLVLRDKLANEIDVVGWGTKSSKFETRPAKVTTSKPIILARDNFKDTGDNLQDFKTISERIFPANCGSGLVVVNSISENGCENEFGVGVDCEDNEKPETKPCDGVFKDGACYERVCVNLGDDLTEIPDGFWQDDKGKCHAYVCKNLGEKIQFLPVHHKEISNGECVKIDYPRLEISEILPNPDGDDLGKEFVEFFNPSKERVSLDGYILRHKTTETVLDSGVFIEPGSWWSFDGASLKMTNSGENELILLKPDGQESFKVNYKDAPSGQSWSKFDDGWFWTKKVTKNSKNQRETIDETVGAEEPKVLCRDGYWLNPETNRCRKIVIAKEPAPCKEGYERNPETGRCRKIIEEDDAPKPCPSGYWRNPETGRCRKVVVATAAELSPCPSGYVRNSETNRCRKIVVAKELTPCKDGYERNPETNRCRKIVVANKTLEPCKEGYERNPETNRCRKRVVANLGSNVASKDNADEKKGEFPVFLIIIVIVIGAVSYGIYEWRREIIGFLKKKFPGAKK